MEEQILPSSTIVNVPARTKKTIKKRLVIKEPEKVSLLIEETKPPILLSQFVQPPTEKPIILKRPKALRGKTIKKKLKIIQEELKDIPTSQIIDLETLPSEKVETVMEETIKLKGRRLNEEYIEILGELADIMNKQGEPFRARAYQKAQEVIMTYDKDITDPNQLKGLPAIGSTILTKLVEYYNTGTLAVLERERKNPMNLLTQVHGIGPKKAQELIDKGITTIEQLKASQVLLNASQKTGLKYFEDIQQRIPRNEIVMFEKEMYNIVSEVAPKGTTFEIVGSYRRGKTESGDIDVIITNKEDNKKVFDIILDHLIKKGIIVEVLSRGKTKSLTIIKLPQPGAIARRVDFLYTSPSEYPFATLYFTGSKIFNTVMRNHAQTLGYTLNEHGLSHMEKGVKGKQVDAIFQDEQDIFTFLNMKYKEPKERIDGRSVEFIEPGSELHKEKEKIKQLPSIIIEEEVVETKTKPSTTTKITEWARPERLGKSEIFKQVEQQLLEEENEPPHVSTTKITEWARPERLSKSEIFKQVEQQLLEEENEPPHVSEQIPATQKETQNIKVKSIKIKKKLKIREDEKKEESEIEKLINLFKTEGISAFKGLNEQQLSEMLVYAQNAYTNQQPVMSDEQYDILQEYISEKFPKNKAIKNVGAPVPVDKMEVTLPYDMPSMDKIKPDTGALQKWKQKYSGPYLLSAKLDGVSGLYYTEGPTPKLYTRGDGKVGQDISYLTPYLKLPNVKDIAIRGEFIIKKEVFEKKYSDKYRNPRNLVAGIINSKKIDLDKIKDVDFVAYEVMHPELIPSQQMDMLKTLDIDKVIYTQKAEITNDILSQYLIDWRTNYKYEIDGIIVADNQIYPRTGENPEHAFAFKMMLSDQIAEVKVRDVIWEPSKYGQLKPRVQIDPVMLGGVKIEYATGFNAKFIEDNKIGVGAVIKIIRSGDVIPYILEVVKHAEAPLMPSVPWKWNQTHVDAIMEDFGANEVVLAKKIVSFFKELDVEGAGSGNVMKLVRAGYTTIPEIMDMSLDDFKAVPGFGPKISENLYTNINAAVYEANLPELMVASGIFGQGFGAKKAEAILNQYPDLFMDYLDTQVNADTEDTEEWFDEYTIKVSNVFGMSKKTGEEFVNKVPEFIHFMEKINEVGKLEYVNPMNKLDKSHPLFGKKIVMTGFRDKDLIEEIKARGGEVSGSVSDKTFIVLVKNVDESTGKADEARKRNIPLMTPTEFRNAYL
jgi:NAD-dependent DNA ligase